MKFGQGQSVKRSEDNRFITGQGRYTDDIREDGMAYMAVVRSPYAHADITSLDCEDAKAMDGVLGVFTQADLDAAGYGPMPCVTALDNIDGSKQHYTDRPVLARNRVRYVGEPVAVVIATSRAAARDAADAVIVDYDDLPALGTLEAALHDSAPQIWDHIPDNKIFDWGVGDEAAVDAAFKQAHHITSLRIVNNRVAPNAMENRAAIGEYDPSIGRWTLTTGTQGVNIMQGVLAGMVLKTDPANLRVITPDVGGGFGMKFFVYPEYVCVLHAAKVLGVRVKWTGDRAESLMGDTHGRDLITNAEMAFDKDGKILGLKAHTATNMGGYLSTFGAGIQTVAGGKMLGGNYAIPAIYNRVTGYATNTAPTDAYRGAGRPEATYITERLMDKAARELGLAMDEIRRRNFVRPDQMPFTTALGVTFDTGEFATVLDMGKTFADWDGFAARQADAQKRGKLLGRGLGYYVEITSFGEQQEYSTVTIHGDGTVELRIGTQSTGQGHETAFAQVLSEQLGVPFDAIKVVQGDTDRIAQGQGTGGSRSIHVGGGAVIAGAKAMVDFAKPLAAHALETGEEQLDFKDGNFQVRGTNRGISLMDLAKQDLHTLPTPLVEQYKNGLNVSATYKADHPTFPNGCHIAEVEIDPDTGVTQVTRYHAMDDFGRLLNPMLAAGQVHGGVVQGLGQALLEHAVYEDETAQLITGSFMDYTMPRADDMPDINFGNHVVINPNNPLGVKGCGEAGTIGAMPTIMHAIIDALSVYGIEDIDMPATPEHVWQAIEKAKAA